MSANLPAMQWDEGKFDFQRKLGNFVQYFQVNLPTTPAGVPLQIVDPSVLADAMMDCQTTDDVPEELYQRSLLNINLDDGLPSVDGLPIWERFDGETLDYYALFKEYREMPKLQGTRALARLAESANVSGKYLGALSKVYHWALRCKLFDAYEAAVRERKRQFEIEKLETRHRSAASVLLEKGLSYLEAHPEQLNPKTALQMVELGMKAGRLALGLNQDKPGSTTAPAASININQTAGIAASGGTVEVTQTQQKDKADTDYLQSIVHILDSSGALDKAKAEAIDATYEEIHEAESDSAAF